eukprot:CAMPEP_0115871748 /NCGR_PEP_ID=MMETSP0287-20121206/23052_1 /TAXON_ID=412157 /ORGANISM="Chrysochromulina rotalis, Strain UIO044" /LENGTH=475 /DNA_ID=CAMNT_0003326611 /DNA_START=25 /DNA_END=1449 /DNA_ORIENTATION=+
MPDNDELGCLLFWEARHGRADGVRQLIAEGANLDWGHPSDGSTPLCVAACFDHVAALVALIEAGAGIDACERDTGLTPLAIACIEGCTRSVERLIAAGADTDAADNDGFTPLMHASMAGSKAVAASLLKAGASIEVGTGGVCALELANVQGHAALTKLIEDEVMARRAAREREAAEKAAAERAAAEHEAAEKRAEREAAEKRAAEHRAAEQRAAEQRAAEQHAAEQQAAAEKAAFEQAQRAEAAEKAAAAEKSALEAAAQDAAALAEASSATQPTSFLAARVALGPSDNVREQPPPKMARTRMAAPMPGQFAPTRLEVIQDGDDVVVKLHASEIVRLRPSTGELTLTSGGWRTTSTLEALNTSILDLVPSPKIELVATAEDWSVRDERGVTIPFVDGMAIPTLAENPLRSARLSTASSVALIGATDTSERSGNAAASASSSCGGPGVLPQSCATSSSGGTMGVATSCPNMAVPSS